MNIELTINQKRFSWEISPSDTLLKVLRRHGFFGAKFGGCREGECGACTVLLDGKPINSCTMLAAQVEGHSLTTIESLGENPESGWKESRGLSQLQQSFTESGAIQCGYCTPAMVLAAKSLLDKNPQPDDPEIRDVLSGILCRCTGYLKPVQAIQKISSKDSKAYDKFPVFNDDSSPSENLYTGDESTITRSIALETKIKPIIKISPSEQKTLKQIGKSEIKVDALKLVQGKAAFTDDFEIRGMLYAKVLRSPYAHARIKAIDVSNALKIPGVVCVLTWKDIPRVAYSTAGQSDPIPGPLDSFSLDNKVRFVGDRVAFVAGESEEIAEQAIRSIQVEYEILPTILDPSKSSLAGSVIIHDEPEYVNFDASEPKNNVAGKIRIDIGDVENGFQEADKIFESLYEVQKVQQAHIEPHVVITYWDEDDRLVIRTSTQVPFHVRRILAPVLHLPVRRIRVIKPRIGGGFGGKQEVLIEDVAAHLTIATGRPVRFEYSREEEFIAARSRHPMKIRLKTGVKMDGTITANEMQCLSDTGAYGCHALTVAGNTGHKSMALYVGDGKYRKNPNIRFYSDIVYTNLPPSGAFRGYGVPQGYWPVERHMEKIARTLKLDPIEFRLKNAIRAGEIHPFSTSWSEGREPKPEVIRTVGLEQCIMQGKAAINWDQKFHSEDWHLVEGKPYLRRGIGIATVMQGTAIPYLDMGGASIKMNDDGSFNLLVGATDLGTGSDTILAQMAAEILGTSVNDIIVYSSDTDFTPFDKGAYASSTSYVSGTAVIKAAEIVAGKICVRASKLINKKTGNEEFSPEDIFLDEGRAYAPNGSYVTLAEVGHDSLHHEDQEQIMAVASYVSPVSPPPFAAQFAEVIVDTETGMVKVEKLLMAVDSGVIINPATASGQIEGGMAQALGYALCEEMQYDERGQARETDLIDYHIFHADEMPELGVIFIETFEPSHPFGIKSVAEIPMDGVAPAVGNAVLDACGIQVDSLPITPEKIWRGLQVNHQPSL